MFKSILYRIISSIGLLVVSVAAATYCLATERYVYALPLLLLSIISIHSLYLAYKKHNSNILFLLNALDNGDYSFHFAETKLSRREKELNKMLNRIKEILTNARKEVIENEKFLSVVVESLSTGILIFNKLGHIQMANHAATQLLGLPVFTHLNQLKAVDETFPDLFRNLRPADNVQIKIVNEREELQVALSLSEITLKRGLSKIIIFNNIGNELEAKGIESWIRLIRVMTHEIMNSIAPITSLTETLLSSYKEPQYADDDLYKNTIEALETIDTTAQGLLAFVESYRRFTGIPKPQFSRIELNDLLKNILHLESNRLKEKNIAVEVTPPDGQFTLNADKSQITQVLVNLIKNAEEAVDAVQEGKIRIKVAEHYGKLQVDICNNGSPIPADIAPHIFVPFFTTKEAGTGIGLSVSRYIMRLHGGNLRHHTKDGWTVFSMVF